MKSQELFPEIKFTPPTLEMVRRQALKDGLPEIEADKFHSHYESNGWKVGRVKMRSWTAALTHWRLVWKGQSASPGRVRTVWETSKIIEAKQKLADEIKRKHTVEVATGRRWNSIERQKEYVSLVNEIMQLNAELASM